MKKLLSLSLALVMMLSCMLGQFAFVTAADEVVDYNDAPYAGVYAVVSDVDTTVTTEIGSVAELTAGETGYIYLVKGANEVEITNGATLTVTDLDDNGLSYMDQVNIPVEPVIFGQEDKVAEELYAALAPGESYTFTYVPSQGLNGIVYPYLYFTNDAENTYEVTTDGGFITTIYKPAGYFSSLAWSDAARAQTALLYVKSGENIITIKNVGSNTGILGTIQIHSVGEYQDYHGVADLTPMTLAQLNPTPTPEPTTEPTPEPTPSIYTDSITYNAEDAGIYTVTSDVDVALKNETGSAVNLVDGDEGYIYLIKGNNILETTNAEATLTFTALENNGLDYIDQLDISEQPFPPGDGHPYGAVYQTLEPGDVYTIVFDTNNDGGWNGMVYPYIRLADDGMPASFTITADTGFYAELSKNDYAGYMYESVYGNGDIEYLYLRAGKNVIAFENTGSNPLTITDISFNNPGVLVNKGNEIWVAQSEIQSLKPYTGDAPVMDYGYFPEGWDGVVENHPDYNADAEALYIDAMLPNMSSDDGFELLGTDWGYADETGDVITKGVANAIYLPAGSSATYTLNNIPATGTYVALVRYGQASYTTASLQLINNVDGVDYYAQYNIAPTGNWNSNAWSYNTGYDDFIYLQEGTNELTVYNAGPGGIVFNEFDILPLENNDSYFQYVGTADDTESTWPEGWNGSIVGWPDWDKAANPWTYGVTASTTYTSLTYYPPYTGNGINLSDDIWVNYTVTAPEAGMYLVEADVTGELRLVTEVGNYVEYINGSAPVQYIYLEEGDNVITATGAPGTEFRNASFYQLNNSDDYLGQAKNENTVPEEPYDLAINPNKDMVTSTGYWYKYEYDSNNAAIVQGAGSVVAYDVNVLFPGIYRVQAKIGGTVGPDYFPVVAVDTDSADGYRAELQTINVQDSGAYISTNADGAYQYVYLKEGINHVEVTAGGSHHVLWNVEFKLLTAEEEATVTIDDCKLTPPRPITIAPYTDSITTTKGVDYHMIPERVANDMPVLGEAIGTELVTGEWQRFEVTAKVAGTYQISTTAAVYDDNVTISVKTENSIGTVEYTPSPDNYRNADGGYITLKEGVNSVWVRNDGTGWMYLQSITLTYVEDVELAPGAFVLAQSYIGTPEAITDIPEYTVRNNYNGIHVANITDTAANTVTYQYKINIPTDDYYGIVMTATVPLTPNVKITMSDGVNADIVMMDDALPYFGNQDQSNSVTITPEKVYLPAGEYTMTFALTENEDTGSDPMMMTHVHSFEFTTLTRQDMFLAAMQNATTTEEIAAALEEYVDVIKSDISVTPETDFIYPEYAYSAMLSCAMLESGMYETYEDVKTAYDFAKNMITVADDGAGNLVYTVQVGDWNEVGTTVVVAVYTGENADKLYMVGEGYLEYEEQTYGYVPVEATLYDYIPEDGDTIKVFVWDSFDGLKPVF